MRGRKVVCLVTNWYPTADNPYYGSFFKEQAFALSEYYEFVILHYSESRAVFSSYPREVNVANEEKNTREYNVKVKVSLVYDILNQLSDLKYKMNKSRARIGIGKRVSDSYVRHKTKVIKRLIDKGFPEFDVLYCVDAQYEAGLLRILSNITGKPYIVSEHSPVPPPGLLINDYNYLAIEDANAFLAISHDKIRQLMMQEIKLPKTFYIGNMVDENKFGMAGKRNSDVKTILAIGANSFYKNYEMLIKVIERLCEITNIPFNVMVAGYGANKGYSKEVGRFEERLRSTAFADRLELISEIDRCDIQKIYQKADAFVMTSIQEGQPLAALEAACCGLPIYSTRCGGVEDYVDEKMGRVYDVTDYDGMARGLKAFVEDEIVFEPVYIRQKIISLYGREEFIRKFSEVFETVL